jgi:hypothetical protein
MPLAEVVQIEVATANAGEEERRLEARGHRVERLENAFRIGSAGAVSFIATSRTPDVLVGDKGYSYPGVRRLLAAPLAPRPPQQVARGVAGDRRGEDPRRRGRARQP